MLEIRELKEKKEMLLNYDVLLDLYPSLLIDDYSNELDAMIPHNYGQVAVFEDSMCVGLSGFWLGTKLWCGKYLELDNIVVKKSHRSLGVGKMLFDFLHKKGLEEGVTMLALDSYTSNFKAHKFFYNEGFAPRGFHFITILNAEKVR
jgi:GNAT superfamily N-acetyltransferase